MSVQVVFKSAAHNADDFQLSCEMTWTIAQIKDKLSAMHPSKPKREHQKLIYGGKLLPDHIPLNAVLNQVQDIHIIHLVCPPPDVVNKKTIIESASVSTPPPLNPSAVYPQINEQLVTNSGLSSGGTSGNMWNTFTDPNQQYTAAQQMYMQMMSQYYAQFAGHVPYGTFVPPVVQQNAAETTQAPANPQPRRNDDEDEARDFLDYAYDLVRVIMLAVFLGFYSSPLRVLLVSFIVLAFNVLGRFNRELQRQRREFLQRNNARQSTEHANQEQTPAVNPASENEQSPEETVTNSGASAAVPEVVAAPPPSPSVPSTVATLVSSFFTSLFPSDPLPVNAN